MVCRRKVWRSGSRRIRRGGSRDGVPHLSVVELEFRVRRAEVCLFVWVVNFGLRPWCFFDVYVQLLVLRALGLLLTSPQPKSQGRLVHQSFVMASSNSQEGNGARHKGNQTNCAANESKFVIPEELGDSRETRGLRVDKDKLPINQVVAVWQILWVEAIPREALGTGVGTRDDGICHVPRAVQGGALQALTPFWVWRIRFLEEAADGVCVRLVNK